MVELSLVGADSSTWQLLGAGSPVVVEMDTIEGLVGSFTDSVQTYPGSPGGVVDVRDRVVDPLSGSFTVVVKDPQVWSRFRAAWSTTSDGVLTLARAGGVWSLPVRLAASLPFPTSRPQTGSRIVVSVVSYAGVWSSSFAHAGPAAVTVTNDGDVPVWPDITWTGASTVVVLPSGVRLALPSVITTHSLSMDRRHAGLIRDHNGVVNRSLSESVFVLGEGVPVGQSRVWEIHAGVVLSWKLGYLDPWSGGV